MRTDRRTGREIYDEANSRVSKFFSTRLQTRQLMLYREIIAVCSQIHRRHINTEVYDDK